MNTLAGAALSAADRLESLAQYRAENKAAIIAEGVIKYGWSPDADCANCGDTGQWPNTLSYCGCPAGRARDLRDREQRTRDDWERRWVTTNVPRRFRAYRFESSPLPQSLVQIAIDWIAGRPAETGTNLIILGSIGTGKTGVAVAALYGLHESGVQPLRFQTTSSLIDAMKPGGDEAVLIACQKAAVLVLDDLGTTRGTDFEQDRLFALLNARYEDERPTIVTSNVTIQDLAKSIGDRVVSRLTESCAVLSVDGPDLRKIGRAA